MMLGGPQYIEDELVQELVDGARGEERFRQPFVGIAPLVGRRAVEAHIVELDLADIEDMEFLDHVVFPGLAIAWRFLGGRAAGSRLAEACGRRHAMSSVGIMSAMDIGDGAGCGLDRLDAKRIERGAGSVAVHHATRDCLARTPGKRRYSGR